MTDRNILAAALPRIADWDAAVRRDLPWRRSPTPYHVWISEIMLQQTRIEAVIPYYERFLAELPDVAALASVDDDRLMKLWEGLGYYSRARNLKKAAQQVIERFGGALPATAEELRSLPGIGEYTAGAIASLAFHKPEPAVDGNVLRVLSRLLASKDDVMSPAVRKSVTADLRSIYPSGEQAALVTEGLMELGETLCIPNGEPLCDACPAAALCRARAAGDPTQYPVRIRCAAHRKPDASRNGASFSFTAGKNTRSAAVRKRDCSPACGSFPPARVRSRGRKLPCSSPTRFPLNPAAARSTSSRMSNGI